MNGKINGEKLLSLFTHEMNKSEKFSFLSGVQPFKIRFDSKDFFIYIKNISSAYFKNRPDVNRAQLPQREEFYFIKQSEIPFIFLGYDDKNDVYVCWDFYIAKKRLNLQDNVSFYSRQSWQNQVEKNCFLQKELTNGDKLVLLKRTDIVIFFENIDSFFVSEKDASNDLKTATLIKYNTDEKLYKITDMELMNRLKPLLSGETFHTLEAIQIVQNFYQDKYPTMTYKDWSSLVKSVKFE